MIDSDIHLVMISDSSIESSAPGWMIDNYIHLVMISDSSIESSDPLWMIFTWWWFKIHQWNLELQCRWESSRVGGKCYFWHFIPTYWMESSNEIITSCILFHTGADYSIHGNEIITRCISVSIIHTGTVDSIMNLKSSLGVYHYQSFILEQMILLINLKSSPVVYHYQSFTLEQMILLMYLKSSPGVYHYQ